MFRLMLSSVIAQTHPGCRLLLVLTLLIGMISSAAAASISASDFTADSGLPSLPQTCTATASGSVTVTCTSSNQTLQPDGGLVLQVGGVGLTNVITLNNPSTAAFTLVATPASGQTGSCTLTLTMRDGASSTVALTTMNLTVRAAPSISGLPATVFIEAVPVPAFTPSWTPTTTANAPFTVMAASAVTVTATSSDQVVLPNANLVLSGTYSLQISSVQGHSGPVTVTISANDGIATVSQTLVVQVSGLTLPINSIAVTMAPGETRRFYGTTMSDLIGLGGRVEAGGGLQLQWGVSGSALSPVITSYAGLLDGSPSSFRCRANSASDYLEITLSASATPGPLASHLLVGVFSYDETKFGQYQPVQITVALAGGSSSSGSASGGGGGCGVGAASSTILLLMGFALFAQWHRLS